METRKLIESKNTTRCLACGLDFDTQIGNKKVIEVPDEKRERVGDRDEREIDHGRHGLEFGMESENCERDRVAHQTEADYDQLSNV